MNIVFVNSMRSFGGGERWILEAAEGLGRRGHDVSVAARTGSALAARARAAGLPLVELPMRGDLDVVSVVRLARWLGRRAADVVNVSIERAVRIGCAAARLAGRPAVIERRGLDLPLKPSLLNRMVYERCVARVMANCDAVRRGVVATGVVPPAKMVVVRNGIDPRRVTRGGGAGFRAEFGIAEDAPVVLVVGRLVRDKGHLDAVRAFSTVVSREPSARLLIVGGGKLYGEIRDFAESLVPPGRVVLTGERSDVPAALDAADVLLVTSLREGMPHVVLEAMVAGTPVVATSVAGIPEMIEDGRHGLLVPAGQPARAAEAILALLLDRSLAERLAAEAGRRVRSEFSLEAMIDATERCFEEARRVWATVRKAGDA